MLDDNQVPHANFGARPKFSPFGKIKGYLTAMVAGGALATTAAYLATVVLPDGYRPGDMAGKMAGGLVTWENNTSVDATSNKIRRESDADAQPKAKAQIDVAMATAVINERTQALAPLDTIATMSDVACEGARRFSQVAGRDWQNVLGMVAQVTCGTGDQVRGFVVASQIAAGTTAAAARGMPLRDASVAVQPNPSPSPVTQPVGFPQSRSVQATPPQAGRATVTPVQAQPVTGKPTAMDVLRVMQISRPSQHYDAATVANANKVAAMMPVELRTHLRDGLAPGDDDTFTERVAGLVRLAKAMRD